MIRRFVLASAVFLTAVSLAQAQTRETYPPTYDGDYYGLSRAGVPPGPYAKLGGGYSWDADSRFGNSALYGGGLGFRFLPFLRSDVTFDYRPNFKDVDRGNAHFKNWSAMANAYLDFNLAFMRPLIPYAGVGVGIAQNKVNGSIVNVGGTSVATLTGTTKDQFAWQAMAGVAWYFTPTIALDVAYRYFHGGSAESTTLTGFPARTGDFNTNEVIGYIRFGF